MKLTPKQEAFAHAFVETGNASEAYRRAYTPKRMSPNAIRVEAARLLTHPAIALAIQLSRTTTAEKHEITKDFLVGRLLGIATKAEESERTYSSAVAALMGVAKITGNITDKHEHMGRAGGPIETITSTMTPQEAADAYARTLERDE